MLNKPRLLTPGPTALPENARLALARDMIHHRKPDFKQELAEAQTGLRRLFGSAGPVLPLAASGSGAMTAAVSALFRPGEEILVLEGGVFGRRWAEIARAFGLKAHSLPLAPGRAADPAELAGILAARPGLKGVCVQLCETSTGVQHPVRELAAVTAASPSLLLVDGISGVGITPCPMDEWGLDCLLTGSQKGLMLPPGLSFIALSPRAWEKAEQVRGGAFYFDLLAEREAILQHQTHFTPAIGLLLGLRRSLELFFETGLDNVYRKHWALSCMARKGVEGMGLELFAPSAPAWGLTSLLAPPGLKAEEILAAALRDCGLTLAAGQGELKKRLIRIGHMGWVDWGDLAAALHGLHRACRGLGADLAGNYLEPALESYWLALERGCPGRPAPQQDAPS